LLVGVFLWEYYLGGIIPRPLPLFSTALPYTPWPTPPTAGEFDFPLLPAEAYGSLEYTSYGAHNPAFGGRSNCFQDANGMDVPFSALYHAGVDLFGLNDAGGVVWGRAGHAPVHAVADGVTVFVQDAGADGYIVITEHLLAGGDAVYSVYWHVDHVQVQPGQPVALGQTIAVVRDLGFNSHLHWEMRVFRDGSDLFPEGTAGARGRCNGHVAGVAYTWDDDPARAHPDYYGYLDPIVFVASRNP
jgi:murein DD-endopeptidase MepM/ murein hydrolase activator NlpD